MRALFSLLAVLLACSLQARPSGAELSNVPSEVLLRPTDVFWGESAPDRFRVRFATSEGEFVVSIHREWAPFGVDRFFNLVRASFYDDSRFFRIRAGYIAQFGIAGAPEVAAVWRDRSIPDDPVRETNTRGRLAFAMTGPDTRTTQLYINLVDYSHLDDQGFAPIGEVIEGLEVVMRMYAGYDEGAGGGMRGGKQDKIFSEGNAHLDREFPKLSRLERAVVE